MPDNSPARTGICSAHAPIEAGLGGLTPATGPRRFHCVDPRGLSAKGFQRGRTAPRPPARHRHHPGQGTNAIGVGSPRAMPGGQVSGIGRRSLLPGCAETPPTDEAAARSAPRVAAGRTWPARRRRPAGRGRCRSPRGSGAGVGSTAGIRPPAYARARSTSPIPGGSRPPYAWCTSLFSHAPVTSLHGKVLPHRSMHLTSCIHHSFRTARPLPTARPGRLRRTH